MRVRFVGAINGVTGSCTHFKFPRTNAEFLVDCGMSQGENHSAAENALDFPFNPGNLKFMLLTHGHIDHCGLIPKLYRDGFKGKVLCTAATAKIAKVALLDAAKQTDLFDLHDVEKIVFAPVDERPDFGLSKFIPIDDHLFAGFTRSAHILGSVSITLSWMPDDATYRRMVLSGDVGSNTWKNSFQSLLGARQAPFGYPEYILTEATYGGRVRDDQFSCFDGRMKALGDAIREALQAGDTLLVPAFSLQRTQELLFDIVHVLTRESAEFADTPINIIVDSPLARQYTEIFGEELCRRQTYKPSETLYRNRRLVERLDVGDEDAVDGLLKKIFPKNSGEHTSVPCGIHTIRYVTQRVTTEVGKKIIISGSGMCNGGPILTYLRNMICNPRTAILLTGFMAPGTPGAMVECLGKCQEDGTQPPFDEILLGDKAIKVADIRSRIITMKSYYSGHADQNGLLDFIFRVPGAKPGEASVPATVFINHGDNKARGALRDAILGHTPQEGERQINRVEVPVNTTDWFDLDAGDWVPQETRDTVISEILAEQRRTNLLLERLIRAIEG